MHRYSSKAIEDDGLMLSSSTSSLTSGNGKLKYKRISSKATEGLVAGESKMCRICLDDEDSSDLIAPCNCKGTQKYVHRKCLDRWRATREGLAFSMCCECKAKYKMTFPKRAEDETFRLWKFRILVARDVILVLLMVQLAIIFLGLGVKWLDNFEGSPLEGSASPFLKKHTLFLYYMLGFLSLMAILGIVGCTVSICFRGSAGAMDVFGPGLHPIFMVDCVDYSIFAGAGEGAPVLLIIAIIAFALLTVVGIFYGVVISTLIAQRITQRHYGILRKRLLTQDFVVMDLAECDVEDPQHEEIPEHQRNRLRSLGLL